MRLGAIALDVNALAYACLAVLVGVQLVLFGGFAEVYGRHEGIVQEQRLARWTKLLRLETCAAIGLGLIAIGLTGTILALSAWGAGGFGDQDTRAAIRVVLPSSTAIATGILIIFSGLFASLMTLRVVHAQVPSAAAKAAEESGPRADYDDDDLVGA